MATLCLIVTYVHSISFIFLLKKDIPHIFCQMVYTGIWYVTIIWSEILFKKIYIFDFVTPLLNMVLITVWRVQRTHLVWNTIKEVYLIKKLLDKK